MPFTSRKRSTRRAGRRQRGAAVVEFAMVLIPLLLILLGMIDWGYYLYLRAVVTDVAKAGARVGSLNPTLAVARPAATTAARAYLANVGITTATVTNDPPPAPDALCVRIVLATPSITGFTGLFPRMPMLPANASALACMRLEP
jgi:Flp pilus assembly protein TadG